MTNEVGYVDQRELNSQKAAVMSRFLPNEAMGWKTLVTELYLAGPRAEPLITKLHCQNDIPRLRKTSGMHLINGSLIDVAGFWGWLRPEQMSEAGDKWSIHVEQRENSPEGWGLVELPRNWDGYLHSQVCDVANQQVAVIGEFFTGSKRIFWGAGWEGCAAPGLPVLEDGDFGQAEPASLTLLGVLSIPSTGFSSVRHLAAAWGNQKGAFLGWERAESMAEVREMIAGEDHWVIQGQRQLGPLGDWDEFEQRWRKGSWGREL
jgi:hypothetical protein